MRRSKVITGVTAAIAVVGVLTVITVVMPHGRRQSTDSVVDRPTVTGSASTSRPLQASPTHSTVGATDGFNITNESGDILIYGSVGGHVSAPLPASGAWLPGQTLNFEVYTGRFGLDDNTGDAFFLAYPVGGSSTNAGTVDIHFNTAVAGVGSAAYLNPADTALLTATSTNFSPIAADGETWTMSTNQANKIMAVSAAAYTVGPGWTLQGVSQNQLQTSITTASDSQCTTPTTGQSICTLGSVTWTFTS